MALRINSPKSFFISAIDQREFQQNGEENEGNYPIRSSKGYERSQGSKK